MLIKIIILDAIPVHYKTMALTGLRKKELATLTVNRLEFDVEPPHLVLDPNNEKNREGNAVPIRSDLADALRAWLREKGPGIRQVVRHPMRHSTLDLTMNVYTDPALLDVAGAVESLPSFTTGERPAAAVEPATAALDEGSSEEEPARLLAPILAFNMHPSGQSGSTPVKMTASDAAPDEYLSRAIRSCYDNSKGPLSITDSRPSRSGRLAMDIS